jgi:hypothetical protein
MSRAETQARRHPPVRTRGDAPIALGEVMPLGTECRKLATDLLQGLQYSFLSAAAHPEIRFPFGSLEEAFQDAIALRPAEQRWAYHIPARRNARAPLASRQAAFGRYGELGLEEFGSVGLAGVLSQLPALRLDAPRFQGSREIPPPAGAGLRATLTLYITEVACLDQTIPEAPIGEEISVGGLAFDANGEVIKLGHFLVRHDFENGVVKDYGIPGRKFCEFVIPDIAGESPLTYGAAAFLAVSDRVGFSEGLVRAWAKAGPILRGALEPRVFPQAAGWVLEQFGEWLAEAFQDDVFPPGLAFASLHTARVTDHITGELGQIMFAGRHGRYRVCGQWQVTRG